MKSKLYYVALAAICQMGPMALHAQENPLAKYLEVPGAQTTLPVISAKSPFSLAFVQDAQRRFENWCRIVRIWRRSYISFPFF